MLGTARWVGTSANRDWQGRRGCDLADEDILQVCFLCSGA
jgi:hypothetical protein